MIPIRRPNVFQIVTDLDKTGESDGLYHFDPGLNVSAYDSIPSDIHPKVEARIVELIEDRDSDVFPGRSDSTRRGHGFRGALPAFPGARPSRFATWASIPLLPPEMGMLGTDRIWASPPKPLVTNSNRLPVTRRPDVDDLVGRDCLCSFIYGRSFSLGD